MESIIKQIRNKKNTEKPSVAPSIRGGKSTNRSKSFVEDLDTGPTLETAIQEKILKPKKTTQSKPSKKEILSPDSKKLNEIEDMRKYVKKNNTGTKKITKKQPHYDSEMDNDGDVDENGKYNENYEDFLWIKGELLYETYMSWISPNQDHPEFIDLPENQQKAWTKAVSLDFNKNSKKNSN